MSYERSDELIAGYRDFTQIGAGGFAVVFRAFEEKFDRVVAVKVLTVHLDERARQRFIRECQATGRLSGHPNVVTVLDAGFTREGQPFLSTQLMERGSLGDWLETHGAMPLADVLQVGVKMCGALTAVHAAGILHRDIKPQNILVSAYGEPALADFGVSAVGMGSGVASATMAFTPEYTAPEVLEGQPPSPEMDVYSLGSALYTLLAGAPAYEHDETEGLLPFLRRLMNEPVPMFEDGVAPLSVYTVLEKAMAKEPVRRYQTAEDFGYALQSLQAELGLAVTPLVTTPELADETSSSPVASLLTTHPTPTPTTDGSSRRNAPMLVVAVIVAVALLGLGLVFATRSSTDVPTGAAAAAAPVGTPATAPRVTTLNATPPGRGGRARIGIADELPRLNPSQNLGGSPAVTSVTTAVFEPLVRAGADGRPVPFLAESIEPNADFTEWTITLRNGITFHDGSPFDADAVAANIQARRQNPISAPSLRPVIGIDTLDARSVRIRMSSPWSSFGLILSTPAALMVAPTMLNSAESTTPIGTGPFVASGGPSGSSLKLKRNATYWQSGQPYLDEVEFRSFTDDSRLSDAFDRGELDLMLTNDASSISHEQALAPLITNIDSQLTYVVLNTSSPPFDDEQARLALAHGTDRKVIADRAVGASGHPAPSPIPDQPVWRGTEVHELPYDLTKARELVAAYQTRTGRTLDVQLSTVLTGNFGRLAQELKKMWSDAGINVTVNALELQNLNTGIVLGRTQAALSVVGFADPDLWYAYAHSSTIGALNSISYNLARFGDPAIDDAFVAGRSTNDAASRRKSYGDLFSRINEAGPYLFLTNLPFAVVATPKVTGLRADLGPAISYGSNDWLAGIGVQS